MIAKRVGSSLTLLDKASQAASGTKKLLGKVARQRALQRRVSRAEARETIPGAYAATCAATLEGLIESAQAPVRTLAG